MAEAGQRLAVAFQKGGLGARQDVAGAERRFEICVALGRAHAFQSIGTPLAEERIGGAAAAKRRTSRVSGMVRLVRLAIGRAGDSQARNLRGRFDLGLQGRLGWRWTWWRYLSSAAEEAKCGVPQILAYGPEVWKRMDVEIEWGFKAGMQKADYDGRVEGFLGVPGDAAPLPGDSGTAIEGRNAWKSHAGSGGRRGIAMPVLYIQPADEFVRKMPKFPYGHPLDTRMTVWTKSGSFTFLVRDLDKGPILAPEYGFFVTKAGSGKNARQFAAELAASNAKSIREMTREHPEATWEEAMREIQLPMLPPNTPLPPYQQVEDPPMQVEVPEKRWTDAWRMGASQLKNGELTYMNLALEAPRPIHAMDAVGLHDAAGTWLAGFYSTRHYVRRRFPRRGGEFLHREAVSRHGDHRLPRL